MSKYYSEIYLSTGYQAENCFPLNYFRDRIFDGENEIRLVEMRRDIGSGYMWCNIQGDFVESGDGSCGRFCKDYAPCNGKSGRCKELTNGFTETDKRFVLTKEGLRTEVPSK